MAKIDFTKIEEMLESSQDFSLTEGQYKRLTGRKMPKDNSYLVNRSALSRFAEKHGLKVRVQEKTIWFDRL